MSGDHYCRVKKKGGKIFSVEDCPGKPRDCTDLFHPLLVGDEIR